MNSHSPAIRTEMLSIAGNDALVFAHAQFSSDLRALQEGQWQWSAWLDVRGRVRALLQVARVDADSLRILLRGGQAAKLADALRPFVMRAAVTLQPHSGGPVGTGPALPMHAWERSDAGDVLGCGDYSLVLAAGHSTGARDVPQRWRQAAIVAGHAWLPDAALDTFVPQALSLERLAAVSFAKGCFPGQEIAARLHFRGGHKKHLCRIRGNQVMRAGDTLQHEGGEAGMVLDAVHPGGDMHEALVVLHDEAAALSHAQMQCAGRETGAIEIVHSFPA